MSSVVLVIAISLIALWLGIVCLRRVGRAQYGWSGGGSGTPAVVRWLWAALIACCIMTSVMMLIMAWYQIWRRGIDGAVEASLCARMGLYVSLVGYGLAWLHGRLRIRWPRFSPRGPKLLPPAPDGSGAQEDRADDQ